jgi:hypothetical protein
MRPSLNHCSYENLLEPRPQSQRDERECKKTSSHNYQIKWVNLKKLNTFHHLQTLFSWSTMLVHFLSKHQLYVDLNAFKEFGFEAHVYHTKKAEKNKTPQQKSMKPILFLSQLLTDIKTHYWSTKLEVAKLIWVLKKTHHLIEAAEQSTIIYTDHAAAVEIEHQFSLNTTAVKKLNLRLVRASEYLQRFRLKIQYKSEKTNIISDALFRLLSSNNVHERLASREYQLSQMSQY